eukprot:12384661-Karenia_brevis.AAC.1
MDGHLLDIHPGLGLLVALAGAVGGGPWAYWALQGVRAAYAQPVVHHAVNNVVAAGVETVSNIVDAADWSQ